MTDGILITGGTGFLGMSLLARELEAGEGPDLFLLVRDRARVETMLRALYETPPPGVARLRPVAGDLTAQGLGLAAGDLRDLTAGVGRVVHCAASISFDLPLDRAREINVEGTRRVLALASALPGLARVVHVSTAYVAGRAEGVFREEDPGGAAPFRNTYEHTKWEAERLVADAGLPAVVVRPSIVVGECDSGWTPAFNVLYWPLQAYSRGLVEVLPADPGGIVDVVPVDHVVDVMRAALAEPGASGTFHAVAGSGAPTIAAMIGLASEAIGRPPPRVEPPSGDRETHPAGVFAPYFDVACRFGEERVRRELAISPPPVHDWFGRIVSYAVAARWGKRPFSREAARAAAVA